jgi:divalent metal cation (Fe/Co/Zn/Cd) transporter
MRMASVLQVPTDPTLRRIRQIQAITIVWMIVEACVSLSAAWIARSPALLAFGGDSAIELLSAVVVLWRFREQSQPEQVERRAARIAGALLFAVAACVSVVSAVSLLGYHEPQPTYLGVAVLASAAAIMPWLARQKRQLSAMTNSAALRADAAESALCAYLSWIALVGIGLNTVWHIGWADATAALIIVPLIVREGFQSMRGRACGCC